MSSAASHTHSSDHAIMLWLRLCCVTHHLRAAGRIQRSVLSNCWQLNRLATCL